MGAASSTNESEDTALSMSDSWGSSIDDYFCGGANALCGDFVDDDFEEFPLMDESQWLEKRGSTATYPLIEEKPKRDSEFRRSFSAGDVKAPRPDTTDHSREFALRRGSTVFQPPRSTAFFVPLDGDSNLQPKKLSKQKIKKKKAPDPAEAYESPLPNQIPEYPEGVLPSASSLKPIRKTEPSHKEPNYQVPSRQQQRSTPAVTPRQSSVPAIGSAKMRRKSLRRKSSRSLPAKKSTKKIPTFPIQSYSGVPPEPDPIFQTGRIVD